MAGDWIKLHRKMLASAVMRHGGLCHLWIYCLLRANWQDRTVLLPGTTQQVELKRGQFITGRRALHAALFPELDEDGNKVLRDGSIPHPTTVWRWLESLEAAKQVKIDSAPGYSVVTVENYEAYQSDIDDDAPTVRQPRANRAPEPRQVCANHAPGVRQPCAQNKKGRRKEGKNKDIAAARPDENPKQPSGPHQEFIDLFVGLWAESHAGEKYPFAGKDAKAAQTIRKALGDDPAKWQAVFRAYMAHTGEFYAGHSLSKLQLDLPRFIAEANKPAPRSRVLTVDETAHGRPDGQGGYLYDVKTCTRPECVRPDCVAAREARA